MSRTTPKLLIPVLLAAAVLSSCVDNEYDLSGIDTDGVTVGDKLTAPLGTGTLSAGKILDVDNIDEIYTDEQGNYTAHYRGNVSIDLDELPEIKDKTFSFPALNFDQPFGTGERVSIPAGTEIPAIKASDYAIELDKNRVITRIDSVLFDYSDGKSHLGLDVALNGIRITRGNARLRLSVDFPDGYQLIGPDNEPIDGGPYTKVIDLSEAPAASLDFRIVKIITDPNDRISCNATLEFPEQSTADLDATVALSVTGALRRMDYRVVYGEFDNDFSAETLSIDMGTLDGIFKGNDNTLSFADPHIFFDTESNIGIPLTASLSILATNTASGRQEATEANGLQLLAPETYGTAATNKIWIGANEENAEKAGYEFIRNERLGELIKIVPNRIEFGVEVASGIREAMFFPKGGTAKIDYTVEIPFAPAADFKADIEETIEDAFDQDLIDYLFTDGDATILGTLTNALPLNFSLNMIITDDAGNPVGIGFAPQSIGSCASDGSATESPVSFSIGESDMPKMRNARNIVLRFTATGDASTAGRSLRPEQEIELELKIRKNGGITID